MTAEILGLRTVEDVITKLGPAPSVARLEAPEYLQLTEEENQPKPRLGLAVLSMRDHSTNEGWELFQGLECAGYELYGHGIGSSLTDVRQILCRVLPSTILLQDKREYDPSSPNDFRDPKARFTGVNALARRPDIFKLTIIKDAHQRPNYHRQSAEEMGCHCWVTYYHPRIVCHLAPYIRPEHLIRTYHSVNPNLVPPYSPEGRKGCLLSGALGYAYPLRMAVWKHRESLPNLVWLKHPGYHRNGCNTPAYLQTLSKFKVAICTSSVYGYALRKIIEATACGCRVVTDLPVDDVLPGIDGNLIRVSPNINMKALASLLRHLQDRYDPDTQQHFAETALRLYDYRVLGLTLATQIEAKRLSYNQTTQVG